METNCPVIGDLYRHYKGGLYEVEDFAEDAGRDDRGTMVLYHSVSEPGKKWARPLSEWNETVSSTRTSSALKVGVGKKRFTHVPLTDELVEELWDMLEDIPFYDDSPEDDLLLAQDWFIFFEFSPRESIWQWFDEHHSKGVHYLLYEYERKKD